MIRESLHSRIEEEKNLKYKLEEKNKCLAEEEDELIKKIKTTTNIHKTCKNNFIFRAGRIRESRKTKN